MAIEYPIRLQSYLAKSGFGSRRSCEKLIEEGRVQLNGKIVVAMGVKVTADDAVTVDGIPADPIQQVYYIALHKPKGYVCTNYDQHEQRYARDLIHVPYAKVLFHVGRLDKESSGLMLYTNDGYAAQKIMHPSSKIEKEYLVLTDKPIDVQHLREAVRGVSVDGSRTYQIKHFALVGKRQVRVTLTEGKNREIRNLFEFFGYTIKQLVRLRIGVITLDDLKPGAYRKVSSSEIAALLHGEKSGKP